MFANVKKVFGKAAAVAVVLSCVVSSAFAMATPPSGEVPERIVSLSPAATEILFAVGAGDKVVAVDEFSDYPAEAKDIEKVGGFDGKTLSIEKILSFEPDFVYLTDGMHNHLIDSLEKYGIKYYVSTGKSVDDVLKEILEVGDILGQRKEAKEVVKGIEKIVENAADGAATNSDGTATKGGVSVYYEVWNAPYMSIGGDTFISDVIAKAGGSNIFGDLTAWPSVSEEAIIAANPDVILIQASSGLKAEDVAKRAGWEEISAVKNNKVFVVDDNIYSRPSPRIGVAVKQLSELLK